MHISGIFLRYTLFLLMLSLSGLFISVELLYLMKTRYIFAGIKVSYSIISFLFLMFTATISTFFIGITFHRLWTVIKIREKVELKGKK